MTVPLRSLLIRKGLLVDGSGTRRADLLVRDGRIAAARRGIEPPEPGFPVLDASGLWILPGGVDLHVHLSAPPGTAPSWADDFSTGSRAALAGGVTTVGNMAFPGAGETLPAQLARETELAKSGSVDVVLHPVIQAPPTPELLDSLGELTVRGLRTLKVFTTSPAFDPRGAAWEALFRKAAALGLLVFVHCEDRRLLARAVRRLANQGRGDFRLFPRSRPPASEVEALRQALALAERTGARLYVVHLSTAAGLRLCVEARSRGIDVAVETRPLYLHLTEEVYQRSEPQLFVATPPPRGEKDRLALWGGLADGSIDTVGSDHAPWHRPDKLSSAHTLERPRAGVPNLQEMLRMLFSEGVAGGRLTPERFVQLSAETPARLLGLFPRKGSLAPGADADVVAWEPQRPWTTRSSEALSACGYSIYEGFRGIGAPVLTIRRGEVIFAEGRVTAADGSGRVLVPGAPPASRPDRS